MSSFAAILVGPIPFDFNCMTSSDLALAVGFFPLYRQLFRRKWYRKQLGFTGVVIAEQNKHRALTAGDLHFHCLLNANDVYRPYVAMVSYLWDLGGCKVQCDFAESVRYAISKMCFLDQN